MPGSATGSARADQPAGLAGALPERQGRGLLLPAARHARHAGGDQTHPAARGGSKKRADYLYVEDARGLLALAQFGAIEFHTWGCRVDQPERPDRIVFDLDPDEGLPWREVVSAARGVADALRELGLVPFVKTTGGKGLHVVVPITRRHGWPEVRAFCEAFARRQAQQAPTRFTANMAKRERRGASFSTICAMRAAPPRSPPIRCARPGVPPRRRLPGPSSTCSSTRANSTTHRARALATTSTIPGRKSTRRARLAQARRLSAPPAADPQRTVRVAVNARLSVMSTAITRPGQ